MSRQALPRLDIAEQTNIGKRRLRNEDACRVLVPDPHTSQVRQGALFLVADGMGGLGGGEVASHCGADELVRRYYETEQDPECPPSVRLQQALEAANRYVRSQAPQLGLRRIGTTMTGLVLTAEQEALVFNIGDSRVYRVRNGEIVQLTRDQSVVAQQIEGGLITQEEARLIRNSNITAFIGQPMPLESCVQSISTQPGDLFIMCSDGLWGVMEPDEMLELVERVPASRGADRLVQLALDRGAPDNVTVILLRIGTVSRRWWLGLLAALLVLVVLGGLLLTQPG